MEIKFTLNGKQVSVDVSPSMRLLDVLRDVNVSYPVGGKSNFRMVRDNVRISFMFARMTIGMWLRYPMLLKRKKRARSEAQNRDDSRK